MRIIECGLKEEEVICPSCESKLAYTSEDVRKRIAPYSKPFIYCPVCQRKIEVGND